MLLPPSREAHGFVVWKAGVIELKPGSARAWGQFKPNDGMDVRPPV